MKFIFCLKENDEGCDAGKGADAYVEKAHRLVKPQKIKALTFGATKDR